MFIITPNQDILLTRGDTAPIDVMVRNPDGTVYIPQSGDVIELNVRAAVDAPVLISKQGQSVQLDPADTAKLPNGKYVYDVTITQADGTVSTIIPLRKFILQSEV